MCVCICICVFMTVSQFYLLKNIDKLSFLSFDELYSSNQVLLVVKNSPANAEDIRDTGSISWRRDGNPLQYSCLKNPHGQRSLKT